MEDRIRVLGQEDIHALFQMTPYYWKTPSRLSASGGAGGAGGHHQLRYPCLSPGGVRLPKIFLPMGAAMQRPTFCEILCFFLTYCSLYYTYSHNLSSSGVKKEVPMNRLFRRLSLLLCVLLLLITALSGCGTSPAAPSDPSTPRLPRRRTRPCAVRPSSRHYL